MQKNRLWGRKWGSCGCTPVIHFAHSAKWEGSAIEAAGEGLSSAGLLPLKDTGYAEDSKELSGFQALTEAGQ